MNVFKNKEEINMKKLFKKVVTGALLATMSVSLLGCSKEEEAVTLTVGDTAEGALEGVTLKVGTSGLFAPFSYYDEDGTTLIGYDVDFLAALQDYLGFEIDGDVQAMDYSTLTTSVASGKLDIAMAALCATDERKEKMNFSDTYYDSGQILCVNEETSPAEITSSEDLKSGDYVVAVEKGTASDLYIQNLGVPEGSIEVHDTITTAYESLEQGKVDCLIQDTPGMAYYIKTVEGTKLKMIGEEFNNGQAPYAVAISFDCSEKYAEIVTIFNQAIKELTEAGTMDEINTKWCE
jgi:ABC-type amino acid transport substrate-binding protein